MMSSVIFGSNIIKLRNFSKIALLQMFYFSNDLIYFYMPSKIYYHHIHDDEVFKLQVNLFLNPE